MFHPSLEDNAVIAEWTYNVLVDALTRISTIPNEEMKPWIAGPGRQTMLHSGLVAYAHSSLKILSACDEQPKGLKHNIHTTNALVFGKQPRTFVIMPYSRTIQPTLTKVKNWGEALLKVKPPRYLKDWSVAMNSMQKKFKRVHQASLTPDAIDTSGSFVAVGAFCCRSRRSHLASPTTRLPRHRLDI